MDFVQHLEQTGYLTNKLSGLLQVTKHEKELLLMTKKLACSFQFIDKGQVSRNKS